MIFHSTTGRIPSTLSSVPIKRGDHRTSPKNGSLPNDLGEEIMKLCCLLYTGCIATTSYVAWELGKKSYANAYRRVPIVSLQPDGDFSDSVDLLGTNGFTSGSHEGIFFPSSLPAASAAINVPSSASMSTLSATLSQSVDNKLTDLKTSSSFKVSPSWLSG